MNIFIVKINIGEITNFTQLKSNFRRKVKELHPDITGKDSKGFILAYQEYLDAKNFLDLKIIQKINKEFQKTIYKKEDMLELFADLMASNFPLDKKVASHNRLYLQRINQMNCIVNSLIQEKNLFKLFENDLLHLRGESVVLNHEYNVIISYLNNIRDYIIFKNRRGKNYIENTYDLIIGIAVSKELKYFIRYVNWLVIDVIGREKLNGNLPTTAST